MLSRLGRSTIRKPTIGLIAIPVLGAVGAAVWFALRGPDARASAIAGALSALASTTAALTALYLSRQALRRTDQQLAHARRMAMLSRYPLLCPVHQSVSFPNSSGDIAAHPPATGRFKLNPPAAGTYAFVSDVKDTFLIPVENAGEGPALQACGILWRRNGRSGRLVGPTVVGAGRIGVFTASLGLVATELPPTFVAAITEVCADEGTDLYWLEMAYVDVFGNELGNRAIFDARGLGAWHVTTPDNEVTNPSEPGTVTHRGAVDGQM